VSLREISLPNEVPHKLAHVQDAAELEEGAPAGAPGWQEAYYTLLLLQKVREGRGGGRLPFWPFGRVVVFPSKRGSRGWE
jgi:hypothetical protein